MKKPAPTFIDHLYRRTFGRHVAPGDRALREKFVTARRFVLDDSMSEFLADLSTAAFPNTRDRNKDRTAGNMVDQFRVSARAPHRCTWVEINLQKYLRRLHTEYDNVEKVVGFDSAEAPNVEGWLIEQHETLDYAFKMHLFAQAIEPDETGCRVWIFPYAYAWTTTADPLPWKVMTDAAAEHGGKHFVGALLTAIRGYRFHQHSDKVNVIESQYVPQLHKGDGEDVLRLVREWAGVMRRVWALLATVNDIPVLKRDVVQAKGFVARGRYRRYLDHQTITLHVPIKSDLRKIARKAVSLARRRAHSVRGHWRIDWHHRPLALCQHEWQTDNVCGVCGGHRLWIAEHERGDASVGFVTHDYQVKHEQVGAPS